MSNQTPKYQQLLVSFVLLCVLCVPAFAQYQPAPHPAGIPLNTVKVWEPQRPMTSLSDLHNSSRTVEELKLITQYLDGLGRPLQTVQWQASPAKKDVVAPVVYDAWGREPFKFIPYTQTTGNTSDGAFKPDPFESQRQFMNAQYGAQGETYYYGQTEYEASPLNRPLKTLAPGNNWVGAGRGISVRTWFNTAADDVKIWKVTSGAPGSFGTCAVTGSYAPGTLIKSLSTDEQGKQVIEFKTKDGKTILKKVQLTAANDNGTGSGYTGWLSTCYIYDDLNRLRCVVQPKATELLTTNNYQLTTTLLNEQCFRYEYDRQGRIAMKKVPGAGAVTMVYDKRDRLVMTQDANLQAAGKWLVTRYDELNRLVQTGLLQNNFWNGKTIEQHRTDAGQSDQYPFVNGSPPAAPYWELLTETGYDSYANLPNGLSANFNNSYVNSNNFITTYNTAPHYARPLQQSTGVKGMVTWTKVKVPGSADTWINAVNIYDDRGRLIQVQSTNISGGLDIVTTQYDFAGKVLRSHTRHQKAGNNAGEYQLASAITYDHGGRMLELKRKLNAGPEQRIVKNEYDEAGRLQNKKLGQKPDAAAGTPLAMQQFEYNIRGWLLSINKNFIENSGGHADDKYFGLQLGYDRDGYGVFENKQYNGNISGTIWRSRGDNQIRRYNFAYDAANRLLKAEFTEYHSGTWNTGAGIDFSMKMGDGQDPLSAYDANGNILAMHQKGWKLNGGSGWVDQLTYTYLPQSNKLLQVSDAANDPQSRLGDFKYNPATKTATDYLYDANGNMVTDNNKQISGIAYNYLNLPQSITVSGKGTIAYTYDAAGNKWKKTVTEGNKTTTTLYISGFEYKNDTLQQIAHEEGRIRVLANNSQPTTNNFTFDYFLKDHLGNVRMVLTEQRDTARYLATMEAGYRNTETQLFANVAETAFPVSGISQYPEDNTTEPNNFVARTNGTYLPVGPAITLKVMAGDKLDLATRAFYTSQVIEGKNDIKQDLFEVLAATMSGTVSQAALGKASLADLSAPSGPLPGILQTFLNNPNRADGDGPVACLNWILLDEQFRYVPEGSGFIKINSPNILETLAQIDLDIRKNGYIFAFLSNETKNFDVVFDNLSIAHRPGALLEETHYYPFGLTMSGISSRAAGRLENKLKYNSKELQSKEYSDGSGLDIYDFGARFQDPQIGRWHNIDPLTEQVYSHSPYVYVANNPIALIDPDGRIFEGDVDFVNRTKDEAGRLIKSEEKTQKNLQARINKRAAKGKSTANLERQLQDSKDKVGELNAMITEIGEMNASETVYYVNSSSSEDGTSYDVANKRVNIGIKNSSDFAAFSHELKHGYQFEKGLVDFEGKEGKPFVLYDLTDEISAYKREYAFGSNPTGSSYMSGINAGNVRSLSEQKRDAFGNIITAYPYKNLFNGDINSSTTLGAINQAWVLAGGLPIPGVEKYKDLKYLDAKSSGVLIGFISK